MSADLLFIGPLQSAEDCQSNPHCSVASNRDKLLIFDGLGDLGVGTEAIAVLPIACYPRGDRFYVRRQAQWLDPAGRIRLAYAPFVNWSPLKGPTTLVGCLVELARLYRRKAWRPRWILIMNPMVRTAPAALLARTLWKAPIVGYISDGDAVPSGWLSYVSPATIRNRMRWAAIRACDAWISYSSKARPHLPPGRPFMLAWSGLADDIVGLQRKLEATRPNVLYSGSLLIADGVEMLLDAFSRVTDQDVELRICGRGPLASEVERRVRLDGRIRYYGFVSRPEYMQLLAQATVAVNPRLSNYRENEFNFPSKLLEYLGAGCPTITTLTGDVEQQFGDHVYPLREETPDGLARKLEEVLALPESEREALGAVARSHVLQNHTWKAQVRRVHEFLLSLDPDARPKSGSRPVCHASSRAP